MNEPNKGNGNQPQGQQRSNEAWREAFEAQQQQLAALTVALTALTGKQQADVNVIRSEREKENKKSELWMADFEKKQADFERATLSGPKRYLVQTPLKPWQVRVIGAPDTANARMKFEHYFGIRQITDPANTPTIIEWDGKAESLPPHIRERTATHLASAN